jgi:selenocysteine lyase/cysteine desulfurase
LPSEDDGYLTDSYVNQITSKTKVLHLTHIINWNGQVLPVAKIAAEARKKGIEVIVDAAHSFAHLQFTFDELGVDYLGTSLHKWLSAPFGSGLLYVRKEKIKNLYPLLAAADPESSDIRKFENLGTRSFAIEQAISHAVDFYERIGAQRKYERLYSLQKYWSDKLKDHPKIKMNHPLNKSHSGAVGNFRIEGKTAEEISIKLFEHYKIHTVAIHWENIHGVRVTPNVYSTHAELDKFINAVLKIAEN